MPIEYFHQIWDTVLLVPPGRVASYGQIAEEAGLPRRHRLVGRALKHLPPDSAVPWHRIINAQGRISLEVGSESHRTQRDLLEAEGIEFRGDRIDMDRWGWKP